MAGAFAGGFLSKVGAAQGLRGAGYGVGTLVWPVAVHSRLRRHLKSALGWLLFRLGLHHRLLGDRAVIVVFHRVDDRYRDDPITHTAAQFERLVAFFARYFQVVSVSELLDRMARGGAIGGHLAITFDDGYRDNATVAAPILARYGARACFFVIADFVGTDINPAWDRRVNIRSEWMTWEQILDLRAQGHEIGAHTISHPDLGLVGGAAAADEIEGSRRELETRLGTPVTLFAYPYGGKNQLKEENRDLVKSTGLRACLSAFGGTVRSGDDPHRLQRVPMSQWFLSPYQFGLELVLGQVEENES